MTAAPTLLNNPNWKVELQQVIDAMGYEERLEWAFRFAPSPWTIALNEEGRRSAMVAPEPGT